jgi:hypothetical protein
MRHDPRFAPVLPAPQIVPPSRDCWSSPELRLAPPLAGEPSAIGALPPRENRRSRPIWILRPGSDLTTGQPAVYRSIDLLGRSFAQRPLCFIDSQERPPVV